MFLISSYNSSTFLPRNAAILAGVLSDLRASNVAFATLILWARGKCNFIQKLSLKLPTEDELELAICAMKKLLNDENMV